MTNRTLLTVVAIVTALVVALFVVAQPAQADTRCNGNPGVQVWQDANKGGPSAIFCSTLGNIYQADLSKNTAGLSWGANWNDRISSAQTFNFSTIKSLRFWPDKDFQDLGYGSDRTVTMTGNTYVSCFCNYWGSHYINGFNDRISSFRTVS